MDEGVLSFNLFKNIVDKTPIGVTITESTNNRGDNPIVYVNDAFLDLTGYDRGEIIGRDCRFLQGPDTSKQKTDKIKTAIKNQQPISIQLTNYRKDGEEFQNQLYISRIYDDNDELINFIGFQVDTTEKSQYKSNLELFKEAIEQSAHAIYITDKQGKITYINKKFTEITGYTKKEAIGQNPSILKPGRPIYIKTRKTVSEIL